MKTIASVAVGLATLLSVGVLASAGHASPCRDEAVQDRKDCRMGCREDFQVAKDACLNRDHACVEVCRAQRSECHDATGIDAALRACDDTLETSRQSCRSSTDPDTPERDQCIDQAQVVAFQCRDNAREQAHPGLEQCRANFRDCARACPAAGPGEVVDTGQCRRDAKAAFGDCRDGCKEDFQTAKDTCQNRDHDCVEACRADRYACNQPIYQQSDAAKAQCNSARDAAIGICQQLYAAGTPERDQCVDNAQVDAFRCRDQANENARPGLQSCRADFQACAESCPPS
jgi:hypothetical protein